MTEHDREYYAQRGANHFHGVFLRLVGVALSGQRISLDQFADNIGMNHGRIRRLLTGATDLTLHDLSDAALGIGCELLPEPVRIRFEPVMTAEDLGISHD